MQCFHTDITNAYINVTNVVLKIAPKHASNVPGILVNGHFDSTLGSPGMIIFRPRQYLHARGLLPCNRGAHCALHARTGASDCASCVAIALELARLLVADSLIRLDAPVVFLLNGGEEAFLLGSHAFAARSRFAEGLGAFVNLCAHGLTAKPWRAHQRIGT